MGKRLLMKMLHVDVYCAKPVTKQHAQTIRDLIARTQRKLNEPYFAHTLHLHGDFASTFITQCQGITLNFSTVPSKLCDLGIVIGTAPSSFYKKREQVLACPDRVEKR